MNDKSIINNIVDFISELPAQEFSKETLEVAGLIFNQKVYDQLAGQSEDVRMRRAHFTLIKGGK